MCERLSPISPKSLANAPKVFGMVPQRLWDGKCYTIQHHVLYHRASYYKPYCTKVYYWQRQKKFPPDAVLFTSGGSSIFITREFQRYRGQKKTPDNVSVFHTRVSGSWRYTVGVLIPGCGGVDGIPWILPWIFGQMYYAGRMRFAPTFIYLYIRTGV